MQKLRGFECSIEREVLGENFVDPANGRNTVFSVGGRKNGSGNFGVSEFNLADRERHTNRGFNDALDCDPEVTSRDNFEDFAGGGH
jgi:hypothetical protein